MREAGNLTLILNRVKQGDSAAQEELFVVAYDELRSAAGAMMTRERAEHTLQPSALINEAALRLIRQNALESMPDRAYFFGAMVRAMRHALIDHARARKALRRDAGAAVLPLDLAIDVMEQQTGYELVALDEALRELATVRERTSQIVELRFFGGLSLAEIADQLEVSLSSVNREWRYARAWLLEQLSVE